MTLDCAKLQRYRKIQTTVITLMNQYSIYPSILPELLYIFFSLIDYLNLDIRKPRLLTLNTSLACISVIKGLCVYNNAVARIP